MRIREDIDSITQEMCDEIKGEHKHLMISIGYTGLMRCFIDMPIEEAKKRYMESDDSLEGVGVTVFGFDDEFNAYEVSKED